jgi:heavy metal translocating P-type ATPase
MSEQLTTGSKIKSSVMLNSAQDVCELCGLRLPKRYFIANPDGNQHFFCCAGCQQVYLLLFESRMLNGDFKESELYLTASRLGIIGKPDDEQPPNESLLKKTLSDTDVKELVLHVDGMWCSSCSWLIEKVVGNEKGIVIARVNFASDTAKICYRPEQISPIEIMRTIDKLGYKTSDRDEFSQDQSIEKKSLLLRMGIALFLMMNIMSFSYVFYIGYFEEVASQIKSLIPFILLLFSIPAVFWCGLPIYRRAYSSLINKAPTMELLFSIGILSAFLYSVYAIITGHEHFYFDTASSLVALLLVGKFFEQSAKQKVTENIHRLYQMMPKKVRLKLPTDERLVSIEKLKPGDRFVVKSGEKIPADGIVVSGRAMIDESLITGESKPIEKQAGSKVIASSLNMNGILEVEAVNVGKETILSSIIQLVDRAISSKSPIERIVDRIARVFIPSIVVLSFITALFVGLTGGDIEESILRGITVLVIACPCALGMATPLAITAGIGYAAKRGILIRDSAAIQLASKTGCVVFDKTGTLTEGKFLFNTIIFPDTNINHTSALRLIGSLEQVSSHPIANAIIQVCREKNISLLEPFNVELFDGMGIKGKVDGKEVVVGNEEFVRQAGFSIDSQRRKLIERFAEEGLTVIFFGIEGEIQSGTIVLGDSLKSTTHDAVDSIKKSDIDVMLLSGDSHRTTTALAQKANIYKYRGEAIPSDKIDTIRQIQQTGITVMMVGDGVNDAPALAQADIGIAIGDGTSLAVEAASVNLMRDDLTLIGESIEVSKRTIRTVKQNLIWAFLYNGVGIVLAITGLLNPLIAAIAMLVSSLTVMGNSMRLREGKGKTISKLIEIFFPWLEPKKVQ